jgi:hypothetical protein
MRLAQRILQQEKTQSTLCPYWRTSWAMCSSNDDWAVLFPDPSKGTTSTVIDALSENNPVSEWSKPIHMHHTSSTNQLENAFAAKNQKHAKLGSALFRETYHHAHPKRGRTTHGTPHMH